MAPRLIKTYADVLYYEANEAFVLYDTISVGNKFNYHLIAVLDINGDVYNLTNALGGRTEVIKGEPEPIQNIKAAHKLKVAPEPTPKTEPELRAPLVSIVGDELCTDPAEFNPMEEESPKPKQPKAQTKPTQPEIHNPVILYELENFNKIFVDKDQITYKTKKGMTKISITDAANYFIEKYHLLASSAGSLNQGNKLWIYDTEKGMYTPNGTGIVKCALDNACGNICTSYHEKEVINRICNQRAFDPERFDPKPYLLCVKNGVIDLKTGAYMKHSPDYLMTMGIDKTYDPEAECPNIKKFLNDIVEDPKDIDTILDFLAVCIIREPYDIFLELIGMGANGKGRLLLFTRWFLGEDNVTSTPLRQLTGRFAGNTVYGKWALINGESEGTFPIEEIKDLVSGNPKTLEIKGGSYHNYTPFLKVLVDTNNPAEIKDTSKGRQRRHYVLNFIKEFVHNPDPSNKMQMLRDDHILDQLCTDKEASGLLNELIERAGEIIAGRPIYRRKTGEQTMNDYDAQTHSVSGFVENWCTMEMKYEEGKLHYTFAHELYAAYKEYCKGINIPAKSQRSLGSYLNNLKLMRKQEGPNRLTAYYGITLLPIYKAAMNAAMGSDEQKTIA
jgi:P4 family phage/plasmid primase-like protien